ncbi:MAG: hypothetical protein L3K08_08440 [Thermoplasmata archaeon]|nr:hypothetical protein [Thermoplasmata archaeon]
MTKRAELRGWIAPAGIALLLSLSVPILAAPLAGAASPNPSAAPQQWAYAGQHWLNASVTTPHGEYQLSEHFGWTLVYTLTNTSNSTFTLEGQRTMGLDYHAALCAPSCAHSTSAVDLSVVGEERETGFANFTTNASVDENGTIAPALGLLDSQSAAQASLNESMNGTRTNLGISYSGGAQVDVSGSAHTQATFTPALGLIPWTLAPGLTWNSSAAFAASGGFALQYAFDLHGPNGSVNGSGTPSGQMNRSGEVDLLGTDLGNLTLAGGQTTAVIALAWVAGPFDAVDGVILLPHGFEIFGAGPHPWGGNAPGAQSVLTSRFDVVSDLLHHRLRVAAAGRHGRARRIRRLGDPGAGPSPAGDGSERPVDLRLPARPLLGRLPELPIAPTPRRDVPHRPGRRGRGGFHRGHRV